MLGAVIGDIAGSRSSLTTTVTPILIFSAPTATLPMTRFALLPLPIGFYKAATIIWPLFCKAGVGHIPVRKAHMAAASHNG